MKIYQFNIATSAGGAWSETVSGIYGRLVQYRYVPDATSPLATGADLDLVGAQSGFVYINQDDIGTSAFQKLPRLATSDETGAASLYAGSGEPVEDCAAIAEPITASISSGGNSKLGVLYIWVE